MLLISFDVPFLQKEKKNAQQGSSPCLPLPTPASVYGIILIIVSGGRKPTVYTLAQDQFV